MRKIAYVLFALLISNASMRGQDAIPLPGGEQLKKQTPAIYGVPGSHLLQQDWQKIGPILNKALKESGLTLDQLALRKQTAWNFTVGSTRSWWATDLTTYTEYAVPSTCRAVGTNCYIFVEDALWTTRVSPQTVDSIRAAFDLRTPTNPSKGIYQLDTEYYGNPPDFDSDPRIVILILDIKDGFTGSGGYTAGYFYSINQYTEALVQSQLGSTRHSNEAEIYYLDANPADLTTTSGFVEGASTTAHEFQHMIHFNYDQDEISFVNEGMSESASGLCGYALRSPALYYANTDLNFLSWNATGNVLADYSRTAIFAWYLIEQFGSSLTKQIVSRTSNGVTGYNESFTALGSGLQFMDALKNFGIAAYLNDRAVDTRFGFQYPVAATPTPHRTHLNPNVSSTTDNILPNGTRYIKFAGGDSLRVTISSSGSLAVSAIATGPSGKRVDPITLGTSYTLNSFGTAYTEVILVITNLGSTVQSYTYSARGSGSVTTVELEQDDGEPTGYLQNANGDTVSVVFPAVAGGRIDSIRVALRRAGSMTGGIWEYSGATRPTPHGKVLASGLTASVSTTPGVPYPVPWPAWSTIDLRSQGISTDKPFVVSFRCVGDGTTNPRVMVNPVPAAEGSSLTYSTTSASGANWYYFTSNSTGDSVWAYLIRAYVRVEPVAPLSVYPGDANNDGVVDARDILPIGQYFGVAGPVRSGGSLTWLAQEIADPWSPSAAAYADCDGNGTIAAADVQAILTNWGRTRAGIAPPAFDRVQMCEDLIAAIEASGSSSEAMESIRAEIQRYMQTSLGISFDYALEQNWPNPFNPSTTIRFSVPENVVSASLSIVNLLGQVVWQKEMTSLSAGRHAVVWNGETLQGGTAASGVYLYALKAGRYHSVKRMTLLK